MLLLIACTTTQQPTDASTDTSAEAPSGPITDLTASIHRVAAEDDAAWVQTPAWQVEAGSASVPLLGIPYDRDVSWRLTWSIDGQEQTTDVASVRTDPLPEGLPLVVSVEGDAAQWEPTGRYLMTSINGSSSDYNIASWTFIIDRQGAVVWALETPQQRVTLHPRLSYDQHSILIDHSSFWAIFDYGAASQVVRVKIDGTIEQTYDTPGLHHPFTEIADGSLVWGASQGWYEEVLTKRTPEGEVVELWSCADFLDALGHEDECGSNTVFWSEERGTYLYSLYSVETVIEIDDATGETLRYFGHLDGAWDFEPVESTFWWQHGVNYLESGNLLLSARASEALEETVVREYALDEQTQTLIEVWNFGIGEGVYGAQMGEAHRLDSGNTLHNYGSTARIREVTDAGEVVWDVQWEANRYIGRSELLLDLYDLL